MFDAQGVTRLNAFQAERIFRNETAMAFGAGQYAKLQEVSDRFPYWEYSTAGDERVRDSHRALDGKIFNTADSQYYPPVGFNCRCRAIPVSRLQAEKRGITGPDTVTPEMKGNLQNAEFIGDKVGNYADWLGKKMESISADAADLITDKAKNLKDILPAAEKFDAKTKNIAEGLSDQQKEYIWSSYIKGDNMADGWRKVAKYLDNQKNTYHRYTQVQTPDSDTGIGFSMFAKNQAEVKGTYGYHHYTVNLKEIDAKIITASDPDFISAVKKSFASPKGKAILDNYITDQKTSKSTIEELISGLNPEKIVDSAQTWDAPDIVELIWDTYLDPKGIAAVETNDGLLVFSKKFIRYAGNEKLKK